MNGRLAYAYSAITSSWAVLELPADLPKGPVIVGVGPFGGGGVGGGGFVDPSATLGGDTLRLFAKDAMYTFDASTGRWKTTPVEKPKP